MTQDKMRKVITACVSAATVLFFLLAGYLIYQGVALSVLDKREKALEKEIAELTQINNDLSNEEQALKDYGMDLLAMKEGYRPAGD